MGRRLHPTIRCSGFETAQDGRCANCTRFHQECIFTPVSSQTQAFVPAHTAYPHLRSANSAPGRGRPVYGQLYGAHGQPLGQVPPPEGYAGEYNQGYGQPAGYGRYDDAASEAGGNRLPTPRRGSGGEYAYGQPPANSIGVAPVSPAASNTSSYQGYPQQQPPPPGYYDQAAPRRASPPYSYDSQGSPQGSTSTASPGYAFGTSGLHPPQVLPPQSGTTPPPPPQSQPPPPGQAPPPNGRSTSSMSIQNLLGETGGRSAADNDMLNALNRGRGRGGR
ncbi:MAG: hypothetical protein M1824_000293 [Vezdaea acicularis]|nr:MAG: hypothetical protein M1824_000293 [Vezdaea acicularis]